MAMRDEIFEAIMKGGATKESLLAMTGTTEKGLASQFTYLRMMGKCPMKQEDGTFKIVSPEEWDAHRASSAGKTGKVLTPAEKVEKARKREQRATSALDNANKRFENDPDNRLYELQKIKAEAELEIASIELGAAEAALAEAPDESVEDDGIEDDGIEDDNEVSEDLE